MSKNKDKLVHIKLTLDPDEKEDKEFLDDLEVIQIYTRSRYKTDMVRFAVRETAKDLIKKGLVEKIE